MEKKTFKLLNWFILKLVNGPLYCADDKFLCENGGVCSNMTYAPQTSLFGFYCSCPTGYTGDLCEISKTPFY